MDKIKLLFVEDDKDLVFIFKNSFEIIGDYEIKTASNGREGLDMYSLYHPDIIVADITMPIMNGKEMVLRIREKDVHTPVIFLTGLDESKYAIAGLEAGADIYLRKHIIPQELDLQIRALLKRVSSKRLQLMGNDECSLGLFGFSAINHYLVRNGKRIELTVHEASILNQLVKNKGNTVSRDEFNKCLYKNDYQPARAIDVHIVSLRHKLADDPFIEIVSVRRKGYILK